MFVPFYSIYWVYISAQRIDKLAKRNSHESDISTLCLILAIFVAFVAPILMQDKINKIIKNTGNQINNYQPYNYSVQNNTMNNQNIDVTEQLKKYKDLFDTGVITEDEFNVKKKQLLNQ